MAGGGGSLESVFSQGFPVTPMFTDFANLRPRQAASNPSRGCGREVHWEGTAMQAGDEKAAQLLPAALLSGVTLGKGLS